jgi:hypothetical protein
VACRPAKGNLIERKASDAESQHVNIRPSSSSIPAVLSVFERGLVLSIKAKVDFVLIIFLDILQ